MRMHESVCRVESAVNLVSEFVLEMEGDLQGDPAEDVAPEDPETSAHIAQEPPNELETFDELTAPHEEIETSWVNAAEQEWYTNHIASPSTDPQEPHLPDF